MRGVLVIGLLACTVAAREPDAAVAAAARWVEPRGCASGSFRSHAAPVVTEVVEAWSLAFEEIAAPPVHWEGRGYVVGRDGSRWHLVGFDLRTGRELARVALKDFVESSGLLVWDHLVLLQPSEDQLNGYRLDGDRFELDWIYRGRRYDGEWRYPSHPVIHDNEIYCFLGPWLARIRPGSTFPTWIQKRGVTVFEDERLFGPPAVHGPHVFVAHLPLHGFVADAPDDPHVHGQEIVSLNLEVYRRSDGESLGSHDLCQAIRGHKDKPGPVVTVAGGTLCVGSSWPLLTQSGFASHVMVPRAKVTGGAGTDGEAGLSSYNAPPAYSRLGMVVVSGEPGKQEWRLYRDRKLYRLTSETVQPDLFRDLVPPTILGDVLYFGTWAMDIETHEILWRLPIESVSHAVVPADGMFLAVEAGRTLRAFRGRERRP